MGTRQVFACVVLLSITAPLAAGVYSAQLAHECDLLMQAAVKRPYGWGWDNTPAVAPAGRSTAPRHVTMEPLGTPAAGFLLLSAAKLLNDPKFEQAAMMTAKGVASAQAANGQIPAHAIFRSTEAGGRDDATPVPDRAATRAGLVLLLGVINNDHAKAEPLNRATQRAVLWLTKQASDDGGWPTAIENESPIAPHDTLRIIRLDSADYRDSTYAMLLASSILGDRPLTIATNKSVQKLLALRLEGKLDEPTDDPADVTKQAAHLWSTAYRMDGSIDKKLKDFPMSADVLASKYAMQTLLGAYLMTGEKQTGVALDAAAQALNEMRRGEHTWKRVYRLAPTTAPASAPTTEQTGDTFHPPPTNVLGPWITGTFGVEPTLDAVNQLKVLGHVRYEQMLAEQFTTQEHLAAAVCGLTDDPLTLQLPVTRAEVNEYLKAHDDQFTAALAGPVPDELAPRLKRLWILLIRAKLENMLEGP
jgi:hypothetical protein